VFRVGGLTRLVNGMGYVDRFCGGSMGTKESFSLGHVAAGTAPMLAVCMSSPEASSCTLADTGFVVTIPADSVAGRCPDTTDIHEVNL